MGCGCSFPTTAGEARGAAPKDRRGKDTSSDQAQDKNDGNSPKKKRTWVLGETVDIKAVYEFGKVLGKGQFGTTRLATELLTGREFACKSIYKRKLLTEGDMEDVRREVQVLYHLAGHPNIVRLRAAFEDRQFVHLVMDLCSGGELFDRIVKRGKYTEKEASMAFHTMVSVIAHCHAMGVMHRDIKPENFLLAGRAEDTELVATDFGLSVFFTESLVFDDIVGSPYYVAPEVLQRHYNKEADVWSLGIMLYILLTGVPPFDGETDEETFEDILRGPLDMSSQPWPQISEPAKDCVRRMLVRDPRRRATVAEILAHPWVRPNGLARSVQLQSGVLHRMQSFAAINRLKKEALKAIAAYLTEEDIRELRARFLAIDSAHTGCVSVENLRSSLIRAGTRIPEAELTVLLQSVQDIGNGTIDYEELLSGTINQSRLEQEQNLYAMLQRLDKDGTGFITQEDVLRAVRCIQGVKPLAHLEALIVSVSKNGAGKVDYEEFCDMMRADNSATLHATKSLRKGLAFSQKSLAKLSGKNWPGV